MDFEIEFTDVTMIQTNGAFQLIEEIMDKDLGADAVWMISTKTIIAHDYGISHFVLKLWNNKKIYIEEYIPSMDAIYGNKDLECLSFWCQQSGWELPNLSRDIAEADMSYWKPCWIMNMVDCDYYNELFGERPSLDFDNENDNYEDDDRNDDE